MCLYATGPRADYPCSTCSGCHVRIHIRRCESCLLSIRSITGCTDGSTPCGVVGRPFPFQLGSWQCTGVSTTEIGPAFLQQVAGHPKTGTESVSARTLLNYEKSTGEAAVFQKRTPSPFLLRGETDSVPDLRLPICASRPLSFHGLRPGSFETASDGSQVHERVLQQRREWPARAMPDAESEAMAEKG